MPRLSVSIFRVSVDELKLVILPADLLLNLDGIFIEDSWLLIPSLMG